MYNKIVKKASILILVVPMALSASMTDIQKLYDQENYTKLIKEAKEDTALYSRVQLHILWGKSAEALGNNEEAIGAYERVLMLTPDNTDIRFDLAQLYANTDRTLLTKQLSEGSDDYQLTVEEQNTILALIDSDDSELSASVNMSAGYDSNINVSPNDIELPNSEEEISTRFIRLQAGLHYTYKPADIENLYLQSGLAISSQINKESYFDLLVGIANAGVGYRGDSFNIYIPLKYSRIHYLNRDLMESVGVNPDLNYVFNSSLIGNLNVKYAQRSFIEESDAIMDDAVIGTGTGLFWIFGDNMAYVKASYSEYRSKHKGASNFIDKEAIEISTGMTYHLNNEIFLDGSYRYRDTSYEDILPVNGQKRNDEYYQIDLKLSRVINEGIVGSLGYSYASNSSNALLSEYRKNIVMCNLKYVY